MTNPIKYKDAGVDIDAANIATERIKKLARTTFNENVLSEIGGFGGMFNATFADTREPVLVASCDGVGTKLKVAFATGVHNTIGYDLVAHCVNDILVQGPNRSSFWITSRRENSIRMSSSKLFRV